MALSLGMVVVVDVKEVKVELPAAVYIRDQT
jgi:hypothetical protein